MFIMCYIQYKQPKVYVIHTPYTYKHFGAAKKQIRGESTVSNINSLYVGQPIENLLEIKEFYTFFEDSLPPHFKSVGERHDFYEAFVIYEGQVRVILNNNSFYIKKGQMFVYTPGVFHSICNDDETECRLQIMSFSASAFPKTNGIYDLESDKIKELKKISSAFDDCLKILSLSDLSSKQLSDLNRKAFVRGVQNQKEVDTAILKKKIEILLLEVLSFNDNMPRTDDTPSDDALSIILGVLNDNIYGRITTADIAKATLMSVPYIEKIFHEYMDMGVMKYYNVMKMQKALNLLNSGHTIKDVSIMLSFANQNYFSTAFKKHFGFPPREVTKAQKSL